MAADENEPKAGKPDSERRSGRDRRQRPPVTIDLKAEKAEDKAEAASANAEAAANASKGSPEGVDTAPPMAEPQPAPPPPREETPRARTPPPAAGRDGWTRIGAAGVAGGVIALVLVIVLQATGLLPVPGRAAATRASEEAQAASDAAAALERRVTAIEAMTADLPAVRSAIDGLAAKASGLEAAQALLAAKSEVEAVGKDLADLGKRLDALPPAASTQDLAALAARVDRIEAAPLAGGGAEAGGVAAIALTGRMGDAEASLAALAKRVDAIEEKIAAPAAAPTAAVESENAARAIAIVALRRAADGSEPFAADLDLAAALGLVGEEVAALRPFAAKGVATRAELAAEFPPVGDAILSATASAGPSRGFFERLVGSVRGLVSIRPTEPMAGDDPPAIVSRIEAAVAKGDLAAALAEREGLPAAGKEVSAAWAAKAADRVAVDELVAKISGSAAAARG